MFPLGPLAVPLITAGIQAASGLVQRGLSERRRKKAMEDFEYEIPSAVTEQMNIARERASQNELPGTDIYRSRMESDMAKTLQKGESVSETASDVLGMYAKMFGQKSAAESELMQKGAEYKSQNQLEMMKSLGLMAEQEGQQFYYNKYLPFVQDMQIATEQSQAGAQNIAGGLQTAYATWLTDFEKQMYQDMFIRNNSNDANFMKYMGNRQVKANEPYWMDKTMQKIQTPNLMQDYRTPLKPIE